MKGGGQPKRTIIGMEVRRWMPDGMWVFVLRTRSAAEGAAAP
jgi:hypothetical protein